MKLERKHLAGLELALQIVAGHIVQDDAAKELRKLIAQASAAPEQEPAHWLAMLAADQRPQQVNDKHVVGFTTKESAEAWVAEKKDFQGWDYTIEPLYTHADPSEVERLREERDSFQRVGILAIERADAAERKLGEAMKLLREADSWVIPKGNISVSIFNRIKEFVLTSAEPADLESTDLYRFLDAAAGDGLICGEVDAGDLFVSLYPEAYERLAAEPAKGGDGEAANG